MQNYTHNMAIVSWRCILWRHFTMCIDLKHLCNQCLFSAHELNWSQLNSSVHKQPHWNTCIQNSLSTNRPSFAAANQVVTTTRVTHASCRPICVDLLQCNKSTQLLSCAYCCQSSQIQSHHSLPMVYALVINNRAHRIQAPLTYLQSSHNHPTFISACITSSQFSLLAALSLSLVTL